MEFVALAILLQWASLHLLSWSEIRCSSEKSDWVEDAPTHGRGLEFQVVFKVPSNPNHFMILILQSC